MAINTKKLEKERMKALGDLLVSECRLAQFSADKIEAILSSGADINYKHSAPIYTAAKNLNFALIKFLTEKGAELNDWAVSHITAMCSYKGYSDALENQFFNLIDILAEKTGRGISLFNPYINFKAVTGELQKLEMLKDKYSFSEKQIALEIHTRIIFEVINNGFDSVLEFVERNVDWINDKTIDLCVLSDEWQVLEYVIQKEGLKNLSDKAVAEAIYSGSFITLNVLEQAGYSFGGKPLFLEKARRAALARSPDSLDFLLKRGYSG